VSCSWRRNEWEKAWQGWQRARIALTVDVSVALALISTIAGFWADSPDRGSGETSLVAATHERDTKEKFSCWMLLGFFKE
jgi:hypothetical protein